MAARSFGSRFLFIARAPGDYGRDLTLAPQLFISDGTAAGTRQISRVLGNRAPYAEFIQAGGMVLFQIDNQHEDGVEIWRTDGTPEGTRRLVSPPEVGNLYSFHGALYVVAIHDATISKVSLWRIPLTGAPPVLLHDNVT